MVTYKNNKEGAYKTVADIVQTGGEAIVLHANLVNDADARRVIENAVLQFGKLDILVNNAGGYIDEDEWNGTIDVWEQTLRQNLVSVMSVSKYAIKQFQKQESGVIVSVASRHAVSGQYDSLAYAASKAALLNVTQAYAKLLAPWGRANAVSPGAVNTGYWLRAPKEELEESLKNNPLKRLIETREVASAILFLASEKSSGITGENILVDGGYTLRQTK